MSKFLFLEMTPAEGEVLTATIGDFVKAELEAGSDPLQAWFRAYEMFVRPMVKATTVEDLRLTRSLLIKQLQAPLPLQAVIFIGMITEELTLRSPTVN